MSKQLVLMDHDGGVDDYLATMLLMTMDHIQPLGVVVTPADCYAEPAVSATRKILYPCSRKHRAWYQPLPPSLPPRFVYR